MSKQPDIDELIRQGFELLEVEDFQGAIKVGKQLQTKRHTSAFEILALAHAGLGNAQRAVVVLEEGIRRGPDVWLLWQLLGNCRSDLGLYDVAHEAYESALKCPGVNASSVHLNAAIALSRQKRLDEAMARLDLVEDNELQPRVEAQRLYIFNERREYEAAIRLAEPLLSGLEKVANGEVVSAIQTRLGYAYWFGRKDIARTIQLAKEALIHDRASKDALWLMREVQGKRSPTAKYFRLLVEGISQEQDENRSMLRFFATYDVVADSVEEALDFVRGLEPDGASRTLKVEESEELESRPMEPKGVYARTGRVLFSGES